MDVDNSGIIDAEELATAMHNIGLELPANEIKEIISLVSIHGEK